MTEFIQVFTTVNSRDNADKIASKLLGERVASCVQVFGPVNTSYWWKGRIERAKEWLCLIKAKEKDYRVIETSIKKVHQYDVPEILALPILKGNIDYLKWIRSETRHKIRGRTKRITTPDPSKRGCPHRK